MRFATLHRSPGRDSRPAPPTAAGQRAFTLAEVLAALAFMAIVIPVAIEGIRLASLAGQVGLRKGAATRVAERALNDWIIQAQSLNSSSSPQTGTAYENALEYRWTIRTEPWNRDTMRLTTVQVTYQVQGREYEVHVSTLLNNVTQ